MTVEAEQLMAQSVAQRIEAIVAAAEGETKQFRLQAEAEAERYRAAEHARVDAELRQLRLEAEAEAQRYVSDAKARIDEFAAARLNSIVTLTDRLIEHADQLQERFDTAETVRRQVYGLIAAIGEVAERLTNEASLPAPEPSRLVMPPVTEGP